MRKGSHHSLDTLAKMRQEPKYCTVEGCGKRMYGRGLCSMHRKRMQKHGSLEKPIKVSWIKGLNWSEETKAKMSASALGRKKSPEARAKMSAAKKGRAPWNKGKKLSLEERLQLSRQFKGRRAWNKGLKTGFAPWLGKIRGPHSERTKAKMSAAHIGRPKSEEHAAKILANNWHGPKPEYKGIRFRSSYEVRFAKLLDGFGLIWQYEPKRFNLVTCSYLPDFYLPEENSYREVKGYFSEESRKKIELFRRMHPETPLLVITEDILEMMELTLEALPEKASTITSIPASGVSTKAEPRNQQLGLMF